MEKIKKSEAEWKAQLSDTAYRVTRKHATERAFTSPLNDAKEDAVFACVCCGEPVFDSEHKFDSGTGWPSYWQPVSEEAVETQVDRTLWMKRTEVHCARCDAHLGHVFPDGPQPTGQRYCINGVALKMEKKS